MRKWERQSLVAFADGESRAYVQGYILACRDLLADIQNAGPEGEEEYLRGLEYAQSCVLQSLVEAQETLEMVNKARGNR
jgi:hypothetical protein